VPAEPESIKTRMWVQKGSSEFDLGQENAQYQEPRKLWVEHLDMAILPPFFRPSTRRAAAIPLQARSMV
jgi:hypothetical protein